MHIILLEISQTKRGYFMILVILGLALIMMILIITICMLCNPDVVNLHIEVIRPWKFFIRIKKDKLCIGNSKTNCFERNDLNF